MLGLLEDAFDLTIGAVANTAERAIGNPVGFAVDTALSPVTNTLDLLEGLTEGEIRAKAASSLGADVAAGMALEELIEVLSNE